MPELPAHWRRLFGMFGGALILASLIFSIALGIVISANFALDQLRERIQNQLVEQLKNVNSRVVLELHRMMELMTVTAIQLVREPVVSSLLKAALAKPEALNAQSRLLIRRHVAQQIFLSSYRGFYLIDRNHRIILGMKDSDTGRSAPYVFEQAFMRLVHGENAVITLPFESDDGSATWVIAPVHDAQRGILGFLALKADGKQFSDVTSNVGRFMESGETYLIDSRGLMLSTSRFNQDLVQQGRLRAGETAALKLKVEPPNSRQPHALTHAAHVVLETRQGGFSAQPYLGYLGNSVYGAWFWDPLLKAGIITEVDADEADELLGQLRNIIFVLLGVVFLMSSMFLVLEFFH